MALGGQQATLEAYALYPCRHRGRQIAPPLFDGDHKAGSTCGRGENETSRRGMRAQTEAVPESRRFLEALFNTIPIGHVIFS
jgi:hypothetical protein